MTTFTGTAKDGSDVIYVDKKRHLWWFGFVGVGVFLLPIWLFFSFGHNPLVTLIPVVYIYFITAIIDKFVGVDNYNTPEEVVPAMMADNYYRYHIHAHIPIFFCYLFSICLVCRHTKPALVGNNRSHHWCRLWQWCHARLHP